MLHHYSHLLNLVDNNKCLYGTCDVLKQQPRDPHLSSKVTYYPVGKIADGGSSFGKQPTTAHEVCCRMITYTYSHRFGIDTGPRCASNGHSTPNAPQTLAFISKLPSNSNLSTHRPEVIVSK